MILSCSPQNKIHYQGLKLCFSNVSWGKFIFHKQLSRLIHNSKTSDRGVRGVWSKAGKGTLENLVTPSDCDKNKKPCDQQMGLLPGKMGNPTPTGEQQPLTGV